MRRDSTNSKANSGDLSANRFWINAGFLVLRNHAVGNLLSAGTAPPGNTGIREIKDDLCLHTILTNPGENSMSDSGVGAEIVHLIKRPLWQNG